ncbi:hypothetical protein PV328_001166 [Microctonus aethiopoides]|uniref:Uncharacterized protein n=1 Tax=Microctonus aethiopoides TaxID=144406 RepID=A0AA39KXA5_9HYME|nr:hypothetical protein PV328_001166 [Microctonus aethiopoides]
MESATFSPRAKSKRKIVCAVKGFESASNKDANDTVDRGCEVCRRASPEQWAVALSRRGDERIVLAERGGDSMVEVPYGSEDRQERVSDAAEFAEGADVAEDAEDAEVVQEERV